jgi:hypothetical protein
LPPVESPSTREDPVAGVRIPRGRFPPGGFKVDQHDDGDRSGIEGTKAEPAWQAVVAVHTETAVVRAHSELSGDFTPLKNKTTLGLADALLRSPANVVHELTENRAAFVRLLVLVAACMMMTGLVMASFSGGYQYLAVPLKLAVGLVFGAGLCLPSLYIFACLTGTRQSFRSVAGALLMGLGVQALILTAFAPVAWIFSQSTTSPGFMGLLYVLMLLVSAGFGLGLTGRVLAATGERVKALRIWSVMFVVVTLQLATNLRPLVGEYQGARVAQKQFFLDHWLGNFRDPS